MEENVSSAVMPVFNTGATKLTWFPPKPKYRRRDKNVRSNTKHRKLYDELDALEFGETWVTTTLRREQTAKVCFSYAQQTKRKMAALIVPGSDPLQILFVRLL